LKDQSLIAAENAACYIHASPQIAVRDFQKCILNYYKKHGRDLPWRRTRDPYAVLVSEVMLQQTQVARVAQKFPPFMKTFPDLRALSEADERELFAVWSGMGYNRRALYLKKSAQAILQIAGGFPHEWSELTKLPGIGEATARAVCVYAFDLPLAYIETNIRTVFIHSFFSGRGQVNDREILPLVEQYMYRRKPSLWYQALMDYGSVLKNIYGNLSRRSSSWRGQSAFEGSTRQIRGRIIRLLIEEPEFTIAEAALSLKVEEEKLKEIAANLAREGLLFFNGKILSLSGSATE